MYLKNDHDQLVQSFLETFIHHKYSPSIKFSLPETELRSLSTLSIYAIRENSNSWYRTTIEILFHPEEGVGHSRIRATVTIVPSVHPSIHPSRH